MKLSRGMLRAAVGALLCAAVLAGCADSAKKTEEAPPMALDPALDLSRVLEKGTLTVGVTEFEPVDYLVDGEWTGLDAELAALFAKELGVKVAFREISWDKKVQLLAAGDIDCVWNAMTRTEELGRSIDCSVPYLSSDEVIVLPRDQFSRYDTAEKCYHLLFAVEDGSAAQKIAAKLNLRTIAYRNQNEVFEAVLKKRCDAAIVDRLFVIVMTAEGAAFHALQYGFPYQEEQICVGLRKGSALTEKLNDFLTAGLSDGTIAAAAERYGLQGAVYAGNG